MKTYCTICGKPIEGKAIGTTLGTVDEDGFWCSEDEGWFLISHISCYDKRDAKYDDCQVVHY